MPRHIRQGDQVVVTAGRDRGQQGKVLRVLTKQQRVVVEGVNLQTKHLRRSQANPQGGVVRREMPVHWSNVSPLAGGKPTRVRFESRPDGTKVRVAVRTGEVLSPPLRKAREDRAG